MEQITNYKNTIKWLVFIVTALAIMMVDLDITAANLALASIGHSLKMNLAQTQWIIDGYLIAAAAFMPFGGRLTDIFGSKIVFLSGLFVFAIASLGVGIAIGPSSIIISRLLQGACIAFTFPVAMVIIREVFPQNQQGFAIGLMVTIAGLSQALGPTIGGMIINALNWRWIFLLDVPLTLIALLIGFYAIPNTSKKISGTAINFLGNSFLIIGLLALITALNEINRWGVTSKEFIILIIIAITTLIIFVIREFFSTKPILDIHLLLNRNFSLVNLVRFNFNFVYFSLLFTLGLFLQNVLQYSALHAGYTLLALTLVFGVLSIPAGKLVDKVGVKLPIIFGLIFLLCGTTILTQPALLFTKPIFLLALALIGIAIALLVPATGAAALFSVPRERGGAAMGIFFTGGFIAGALGVSISGLLLARIGNQKLIHYLNAANLQITDDQLSCIKNMAVGITHSVCDSNTIISDTITHAFTSGFITIMWLAVGMSILALMFASKISRHLGLPEDIC